jgi:hypothetical protein
MRNFLVPLAATALIASGCGIEDPYADREPTERTSAVAGQAGVLAAGAAPPGSPEEALERFTVTLGNWTNHDAVDAYERAATLATGRAAELVRRWHGEMALAVRPEDERLRATVRVESVLVRGVGERRSAVLVTHGNVSGGRLGNGDPSYDVVLAAVEHTGAGWKVADWRPQG